MERIHNVTGTAFIVAEFRAEGGNEDEPLYTDRIVELFLSDETKKAAAHIAASCPPVKEWVKIRTRYFDDVLESEILFGCKQVVILGSGLDTRAVRKQAGGVRYFEIDDGATFEIKQRRFEENGIHADLQFIPGNYAADDLIGLLRSNGFSFDLPTHFIWEGNTMYLATDTVKQVMAQLSEHVRHFTLSFDYMSEAVISRTTGDPSLNGLADSFEGMGAPWVCGIGNIRTLAREVNLKVVNNFTIAELRRAYGRNAPLDLNPLNVYSVCTLGSA